MMKLITQGFKDIKENKGRFFILGSIIFLILCATVPLSTKLMRGDLRDYFNEDVKNFQVLRQSGDLNKQLPYRLNDVYVQGGSSHFYSGIVLQDTIIPDSNVYVVVGEKYSDLLVDGKTTIYSELRDQVVIDDSSIMVVKTLDRSDFDIEEISYQPRWNSLVVVVLNLEETHLKDWILESKEESQLFQLIENTKFSKSEEELKAQFLQKMNESNLSVEEVKMNPYLLLATIDFLALAVVFLMGGIFIYIGYRSIIRKMKKEEKWNPKESLIKLWLRGMPIVLLVSLLGYIVVIIASGELYLPMMIYMGFIFMMMMLPIFISVLCAVVEERRLPE